MRFVEEGLRIPESVLGGLRTLNLALLGNSNNKCLIHTRYVGGLVYLRLLLGSDLQPSGRILSLQSYSTGVYLHRWGGIALRDQLHDDILKECLGNGDRKINIVNVEGT